MINSAKSKERTPWLPAYSRVLMGVCLVVGLLFCGATTKAQSPISAPSPLNLSAIFDEQAGKTEQQIKDLAAQRIAANQITYGSSPDTLPQYLTFTGYIQPNTNAKLAILSDDGCNVVINSQNVLARKGVGQHLPNLTQSLHFIDYTFTAGQVYQVTVEYSNTAYNTPDFDGLTLFCYEGGGSIIGPDITASGDYIVPGSTKNRVDYTTSPATFTADSGTFKVFRNGDTANAIRTIALTDRQLQGGDHYLEWNGYDSNGKPLTEANSPYTFRITLKKGVADLQDEESDRRVKEWGLVFVTQDRSSPDTTFETGANEATIADANGTPKNLQVKAEVSGGTLTEIPFFDVTPDTGPQEWDADVALKRNATGDWFIFYTTPTPIQGHPEIKYAVKLNQIAPYVQDWGGNPWDMNDTTEAQETKTNWAFRISPLGDLLDFQASYE